MQYRSKLLAELGTQFHFSPLHVRRQQARRIEEIIPEIQRDRPYPFDYVYYRVTRFRPANEVAATIEGEDLALDLQTLLLELSRGLHVQASHQKQTPLALEAVARRYKVSANTVRRWRSLGLVVRYFTFGRRRSQIGVRPQALESFLAKHPECLTKVRKSRRLTDDEKRSIVGRARVLRLEGTRTLAEAARRISREVNRSREAIRRVLLQHDEAAGEERLFPEPGRRMAPGEILGLVRAFRSGVSVTELSRRYQRSAGTVYRVLHRALVEHALALTIKVVPNKDFEAPDAQQEILGGDGLFVIPPQPQEPLPKAPPDLPAYLRELYRIPLLTREQERDLFRKYNYVKWRLVKRQDEIRARGYRPAVMDDFEAHRAAAERLRQMLVRSNLRLVVSIAKRHVGPVTGIFGLISEGNLCLMRAVECFDYGRGTRFSTYATWAMTKHFARVVPEANYRLSSHVTGQDELLHAVGDHRMDVAAYEEKQNHIRVTVGRAVDQLPPRERSIINARFGTAGEKPKTLEQLASVFGLTRERIRQIEMRALTKLRRYVGPDAAEVAGI